MNCAKVDRVPIGCISGRRRLPQAGFSLVELMIVVAIIAILAAIAYPNYRDSVIRSARTEAKATMLRVQQCLERTYTLNSVYVPANCAVNTGDLKADRYTLTLVVPSPARSYTITATPTAPFTDPSCGSLTITNTGVKTSTGTSPSTECWKG
jgi:type IV pilus assembly protein PilE